MVRHGRTKKRRAGRYGKTKLKNRSWVRFDPKPKVAKELKKHWDPAKSASENLKDLGLLAKPNDLSKPDKETAKSPRAPSVIEIFDIPESDAPSLRKRFPLEKEEEEYIAKCMAKWGDDYVSMFRDTKVNDLQHTEQKLRKLGARYLLLAPDQRRVLVPERIQDLLPRAPGKDI